MTSIIIRSTFTGAMTLVALVILVASTANASEITGVLNSSGNAPTPSQESAPAPRGSVTDGSDGEISGLIGGLADSSTTGHAPRATNTSGAEAIQEAPAPGVVLSSYTDTPNVPMSNSFVEDTLPSSGSDDLVILSDGTVERTTPFVANASAAAGSAGSISVWWLVAFSLFVVGLGAGLFAYRPRHVEQRWIGAQY